MKGLDTNTMTREKRKQCVFRWSEESLERAVVRFTGDKTSELEKRMTLNEAINFLIKQGLASEGVVFESEQ